MTALTKRTAVLTLVTVIAFVAIYDYAKRPAVSLGELGLAPVSSSYVFLPEDSSFSGIAYEAIYEEKDSSKLLQSSLERTLSTQGYLLATYTQESSTWKNASNGTIEIYRREGETWNHKGIDNMDILGITIFQPVGKSPMNILRATLFSH